jgi:isoleucyl-tRNA synthetase
LDSWFIKTTAFKDRLVELNNTINWKPAATGKGRFGNWLENLVDWNLSRSRYWGTPLPIWRTNDKKESICIGSIEELKAEVKKAKDAGISTIDIDEDFDLHRPFVDDVVLVSPSGKEMLREPDLIDVWFDSGAMPYAQWHYPFENQDKFKSNYPADFIAEGVDQTRGWFFTLHAIAGMLFDSVAFKNVIANGLVLDKDGNKMSKRLGNAIDPFVAIDTYGADSNRWYMISNAQPWENLKFDFEGVKEVQRRFFGTLHNTYNFFALYANIDGFKFEEEGIAYNKLPESDQWVLSRLHSVIDQVTKAFDDYDPTRAARLIQDFTIDDLSNWYVRLNRKRFWVGEFSEDKRAAYETLYTALDTIVKLSAPIIPFVSENYFQQLNKVSGRENIDSIHLGHFPEANEMMIDKALESRIDYAQRVSSLVHSLRKKERVKVRQPLKKIMIPVLDKAAKDEIESVSDMIKNEVNIKEIEILLDDHSVITKTAKANFRELGKKFGPKLKSIVPHIQNMDQGAIDEFEQYGVFTIDLTGESIQLEKDDILIETHDVPGWSVASENGLTVALDINIDEDLKREGFARDIVNRVQNLRKDTGLEVQDKIHIDIISDDDFIKSAIKQFEAYISKETQAEKLSVKSDTGQIEKIDIDGISLGLEIQKI